MTPRIVELDPIDRQLLNEMQDRFPLVPEPFAELAARIGSDDAGVRRAADGRDIGPALHA